MGEPGVELVEQIDEHDRVIDVVTRSRMRAENLRHRSVSIIVVSSDQRLLVHRRSDHKDLHPGWWDICVGGVVGVGEAYGTAARREVAEEIGIDDVRLDSMGMGSWTDEHSTEISALYRTKHDGPFTFADGEITEAKFVTAAEFGTFCRTESVLPGSLAMLLPHLGKLRTARG